MHVTEYSTHRVTTATYTTDSFTINIFCNKSLPGASSSVSESASSKAPAISLNLRERKILNITIQQLLKLMPKHFSVFTLVLFQCAINGYTQILNLGLFLPSLYWNINHTSIQTFEREPLTFYGHIQSLYFGKL